MTWLFPRLLASVLAMGAGALLGFWTGDPVSAPWIGALLGGAIGVAFVAIVDTVRGYRLINWLAGSQEDSAPRDTGFWGEIGYRVERSIRKRERGAAQERLLLSQFLSAMEASPNGILLLDVDDQITWCNSVAADHFGLDPERDRLQPVTNLVRAPGFVAALQAQSTVEPVLVGGLRGRGTVSIVIRSYGDGLRLVLSQDVTERERAESMRRDFVANVSHEIRSPLTVLAGFIETMDSLPLTEVERKRVLSLMGQQAQRMQMLVSDLLTLAQLEGSPRPASDRWILLDKVLLQAESDGRGLSKGRHTFLFPALGDVQLAGNEGELLSAVTNLVNNAVRYTPEGGCISVSWRLRDDGSGELAVSDTGIGIEREHIARLTERFYRVDGSRSRDTGGTGLGLSIVKHVAQRHGGELDVQSEPGKGSRFAVSLPAARVRAPRAALPEPAVVGERSTV